MAKYPGEIVTAVEPFLPKDKKHLVTGERTHASDKSISELLFPSHTPVWDALDIVEQAHSGGLYIITQEAEKWVSRFNLWTMFDRWLAEYPLPTDPVTANPLLRPGEDAPSCADCGSLMVRCGTCYKCLNCGSTLGCS